MSNDVPGGLAKKHDFRFESVLGANKVRIARGVSLLELLVVVGVLAILVGLLAPAVAAARDAQRRASCAMRLRQLGVASANYQAAHGVFPAAANGWGHIPSFFSAHAMLLPYLEESDIYELVNFNLSCSDLGNHPGLATAGQTRVAGFLCPSSEAANGCHLRACAGSTPDASRNDGAFRMFRCARPADFRKGLSATVFFSERMSGADGAEGGILIGPGDPRGGFPPSDWLASTCRSKPWPWTLFAEVGDQWLIGSMRETQFNAVFVPNAPDDDCARSRAKLHGEAAMTARSLHRGGANAVFGDGAATFVAESIDLAVWRQMARAASDRHGL